MFLSDVHRWMDRFCVRERQRKEKNYRKSIIWGKKAHKISLEWTLSLWCIFRICTLIFRSKFKWTEVMNRGWCFFLLCLHTHTHTFVPWKELIILSIDWLNRYHTYEMNARRFPLLFTNHPIRTLWSLARAKRVIANKSHAMALMDQ